MALTLLLNIDIHILWLCCIMFSFILVHAKLLHLSVTDQLLNNPVWLSGAAVMLERCWLVIIPPYLLYTDCRHILYTYYTTGWRLDEWYQTWAAGLLDFALVMRKSLWKKEFDLMKNWTFNEMKADFSMDRMIPREQVLALYWHLLFALHLPLICYMCN